MQQESLSLKKMAEKLKIPENTPVERLKEIRDLLMKHQAMSISAHVAPVDPVTGVEKRPRRSGHTIYIRDDAMEFLQYAADKAGVKLGRLMEDLIKCLWLESK